MHGRAMRLKLAWPLRGMHGDCNGGHAAVEWALRHAWGAVMGAMLQPRGEMEVEEANVCIGSERK